MRRIRVVAGLIRKDKKILLCQRKEDDSFGLLWEFPGGKVEEKETDQQALKREIKEELGLDIEVGNLIDIFKDRTSSLEIEVYLYEVLNFKGRPQARECKEFKFLDLKEIPKSVLAPVDKRIFSYLSSL
ncbi:MAG: (deoxy)nucleoside triphosphate pyrophosphohydrolase [Candidatus Omnitrophica bacterium]|nr:(deoxy)nucleoside triphosphate pyrophosphohydrolase [Candidatus Omnitrophota bacterium]